MVRTHTRYAIDDKFRHEAVNDLAVKISGLLKPEVVIEIHVTGANGVDDTTGPLSYDGTVEGLHKVVSALAALVDRLPEGRPKFSIEMEDY